MGFNCSDVTCSQRCVRVLAIAVGGCFSQKPVLILRGYSSSETAVPGEMKETMTERHGCSPLHAGVTAFPAPALLPWPYCTAK